MFIVVQLIIEGQTNDKEAVRYDRCIGRRIQPKGVSDEVLDIIGQGAVVPEGVSCTVEEDVTHPGMVRTSEGEFVPAHLRFGIAVKDAVYHVESVFQV